MENLPQLSPGGNLLAMRQPRAYVLHLSSYHNRVKNDVPNRTAVQAHVVKSYVENICSTISWMERMLKASTKTDFLCSRIFICSDLISGKDCYDRMEKLVYI